MNYESDFPHGSNARGLTKREWFAGMAMQGLLSKNFNPQEINKLPLLCFQIADAMLAESNKQEGVKQSQIN